MTPTSVIDEKLPLSWRLRERLVYYPLIVPWNNRWRMTLIRLIPDRIQYFVICNIAVQAEPDGHPGEVTSSAMMQFLERKHRGKRLWR